jgi:hypothetical protein
MDPNEALEYEIKRADSFFSAFRKGKSKEGKACFFKLAPQKTVDASLKFDRTCFYQNYEYESKEESIECLRQAIILHGPSTTAYIKVALVTSGNSNNDCVLTLKNPFYQGVGIAGIGGIGAMQNPMYQNQQQNQNQNQALLMQLMKQNHDQAMMMSQQITDLKHAQIVKDKDDEIAYLEDGNKSNLAKIGELAETQAGMTIATAIAGFLGKLNAHNVGVQQQPVQQPVQQPIQQPVQQAEQQSDQPTYTQEQMDAGIRIQKSVEKINMVFEDPVTAIEMLAAYIEKNPAQAKMLLSSQQQQQQ